MGEKISSNHVSSHLVITGKANSLYYANEHDELLNTIKDFWETESIGIKEQLSTGATEGADFRTDTKQAYPGKKTACLLPTVIRCAHRVSNPYETN